MTNAQGNRGWAAVTIAAILMMLTAAIAAAAQTFTTLVDFDGAHGSLPEYSPLVQGTDGYLYGTAAFGGAKNHGTVFRMAPNGTLRILYSFCSLANCADGAQPIGGLVLGSDGDFYGTTDAGGGDDNCVLIGTKGCGTVFKITTAGKLTTLHVFDSTDGAFPLDTLLLANDGNFYGTATFGGTTVNNSCTLGCGATFRISPAGAFTTLHEFSGFPNDGAFPIAPLVEPRNGILLGTTGGGGPNGGITGFGTVFKMTTEGSLTILHGFAGSPSEGASPFASLLQASNGAFYGTTAYGGAITNSACLNGCGTVFEITPAGSFNTVHSFDFVDGQDPLSALVQTTNRNFYGTTEFGGAFVNSSCPYGCGTVFEMTPEGSVTTLHSFDLTDGSQPVAALTLDTNGIYYGETFVGGTNNYGTVFSLNVGLGRLVETVPTAGNVGQSVTILGTMLTGASSVTFNGTPATFTAESATAIKATVPVGATTGPVQVVTPSGTLTSNVNFRVLP